MNEPAYPRDEMGLEPHDAFADVVPYHFRERDDQQAARELAEERQRRATEILQTIYGKPWELTKDDLQFLCAELGIDWRDVVR